MPCLQLVSEDTLRSKAANWTQIHWYVSHYCYYWLLLGLPVFLTALSKLGWVGLPCGFLFFTCYCFVTHVFASFHNSNMSVRQPAPLIDWDSEPAVLLTEFPNVVSQQQHVCETTSAFNWLGQWTSRPANRIPQRRFTTATCLWDNQRL